MANGHLLSMTDDDRKGFVEDFILRSAEYRDQFTTEWNDSILGYLNWVEARRDWKSNLRFGLEYAQVETAKSSMYQALLSADPPVAFEPMQAADATRSQVVTRAMHHLLYVRGGIQRAVEDWLDNGLKMGPMVWKIGWRRRTIMVPKFASLPMGEESQRLIVGYDRVLDEGPMVRAVSPWDYLPDPQGDDEETQDVIGHRVWLTDTDLEDRAKAKIYDKKAVKEVLAHYAHGGSAGDPMSRTTKEEEVKRTANRGGETTGGVRRTTERIPIIELWTDFEYVTVAEVGEQSYIELRRGRNPAAHQSKPFVIEHYTRIAGDPIGLSLVRYVKVISDAIASFHNQANDSRRLAIDARYLVREGILLDDEELVGGPGDLIRVPNPATDFLPVPTSGRIELASQEEGVLLQWADRTGAQSDFSRGQPTPGGGNTATEIAQVAQYAQARTYLAVERANRGLCRMYAKALSLTQQNLEQGTAVKMMGRAGYYWRTVSPEEMAGLWAPRARGSFGNNERLQKPQLWLALAREWKDDPYVDPLEFRKRTFAALDEPDIDQLLRDPSAEMEVPQQLENEILMQGIDVPVSPLDDDAKHLLTLRALMSVQTLPDGTPNPASTDPMIRGAIGRHYQKHLMQYQQKQMQMQQQQRSAAGPGQGTGAPAYDGASQTPMGVQGRALAAATPGGGYGHPPGPGPATRNGAGL